MNEMRNIDSDLIRGNIDTIILKTMLEEDKYGLDIIKEVEERSSGTYELKQPTLYSCLRRLENQQLISSYWQDSDIGGRRHYYKLTDKGREFYPQKQEEWAKSKFIIDNLLSNYNYEEYSLVNKDE
jgi:PadR family transcriptional regulator PadR